MVARFQQRVRCAKDQFGALLNGSLVSALPILLVGLGLAVYLTVRRQAGGSDNLLRRETSVAIVMGLTAIFMCTPLSKQVSHLLPKMQSASFAWRWLLIASYFASLALAAVLKHLWNRSDPWPARALLGMGAVASVILALMVSSRVVFRSFSNPPLDRPSTNMDSAYTPRNALESSILPQLPNVRFESEAITFPAGQRMWMENRQIF